MKARTENGQALNGRRGAVFGVRLLPRERAAIEAAQAKGGGPRSIGAWMRWAALERAGGGTTGSSEVATVVPELATQLRLPVAVVGALVLPAPGLGSTSSTTPRGGTTSTAARLILDLCAGSGSWSEPYERAGYRVERVTLPAGDVRTYRPPASVWGVLAAPPCTEFSLAKGSARRDFVRGMETVNACMRIIGQCSPSWWALENPVGLLRRYLGDPVDVWEPCDFGDPWTKRTAIWGRFELPKRGPFVQPTGSAMDRPNAAARAVTPPGFARAFFEANP